MVNATIETLGRNFDHTIWQHFRNTNWRKIEPQLEMFQVFMKPVLARLPQDGMIHGVPCL